MKLLKAIYETLMRPASCGVGAGSGDIDQDHGTIDEGHRD